ncbi:hypothetical protein HU200_061075 [Digitaria exilis]|uniref:F-box domain-containing protein n=1 Tax=Digitaria exilis TaxID=1010633 RepID=A0A835DZR5_9POAL|nr:hypothetical protein HU200_061075 [Digitaria exilis]
MLRAAGCKSNNVNFTSFAMSDHAMASATAARSRIAAAPAAQAALPDELLEDIFLRLGDPGDLVRAYASCSSFCRIIFGPHFLDHYQCLHPPLVVGFLVYACTIHLAPGESLRTIRFHPAEPPHRSLFSGVLAMMDDG